MRPSLIATRLLALATLGGMSPHPVLPAPAPAPTRLPDLIPREVLFPPAEAMQSIQLSPDGATLFYLAPDAAGVLQPWLAPVAGSAPRRCPALAPPGATSPFWAPDGRAVVYQHREGTRQRLLTCDVETGEARELLAIDGGRIDKIMSSPQVPAELLVALRLRDDAEAEVHRLDLVSGRRTLDTGNPGGVPGPNFHADVELRVLAASRTVANGSTEVLVRDAVDAPWRVGGTADGTHSLAIEAISGDGRFLLLRSDLASDMARLVEWRLAGGRERAIAGRRDLDASGSTSAALEASAGPSGSRPTSSGAAGCRTTSSTRPAGPWRAASPTRGESRSSGTPTEATRRSPRSPPHVVYEGDGHFLSRANELDYMARVETLFAHCLGGRAERSASGPAAGGTARVRNLRMPESAVP